MNLLQIAVSVPLALILIYAAARVISAAIFKSKAQFNSQPKQQRKA